MKINDWMKATKTENKVTHARNIFQRGPEIAQFLLQPSNPVENDPVDEYSEIVETNCPSCLSRNSSNYQIIKGAFYFILNADQREYYFEAKLDANQKILYLSINSEPVSSLVTEEDEYLIPLLQKFEGFLMEKYQSLV